MLERVCFARRSTIQIRTARSQHLPHSFVEVMCVFDTSSVSDREKAPQLQTGNVVDISGTCAGKENSRIILLDSKTLER